MMIPGTPVFLGRVLLAALAAFASGVALAQVPALAPKSFKEFVDADERISGSAVVGLAFVGAEGPIDPGHLFAFIDAPPSGDLTLEFNGIDGRYRLLATYDGAGLNGGGPRIVPLQLGKLQHQALLTKYNTAEGAALLSDGSGRHYPVRWGSGTRTDAIRVYVNAERADAFFFAQTPEGRKMVLCTEPRSVTPPFKFNRICDIPASQFAAGKVEIQRRIGSRRLDPVTVEIATSSGR